MRVMKTTADVKSTTVDQKAAKVQYRQVSDVEPEDMLTFLGKAYVFEVNNQVAAYPLIPHDAWQKLLEY